MKKQSKTSIIICCLTILLVVGLYYESSTNTTEVTAKPAANTPSSVNFIVSSMNLVLNDENGQHKAKLVSQKVKHIASLNQTKLFQPKLIINQPDSNWLITADNGEIVHNKIKTKEIEKIILSDNVKIIRNSYSKNNSNNLPFMTLDTSYITYYPQKDLMNTTKKVKITTEDSETTADGLVFNKSTQKLELLSNVVSKYKPANLRQHAKN